jgi:hypothetical protein
MIPAAGKSTDWDAGSVGLRWRGMLRRMICYAGFSGGMFPELTVGNISS